MDKKSIGIIGGGFVGQILKKYYTEAKVFDIKADLSTHSLNEVLKSDYIFVAVNFQDNCWEEKNRFKLSDYFYNMKSGQIVIIKSTFVPGTLDYFQSTHPDLRFVYNPEFLTEATAWNDLTKPQFQILGVPAQSLDKVDEIMKLLPWAPVPRIISPRDAEILKHAFNSYYASKVTWFNQLFDVCNELGADYETIREIMVQNPWVGDSHSVIYHKGYRGYGGKCLSKDPKALSKVAKFPIIDHIEEYNETLKKN